MNWRRWLPVRLYMKVAWERRARRNAMHYVADFRPEWDDEAAFFQTGLDDTEKLLAAAQWGDTSGGRLLEIGCGVGRMTRHLAARFAEVDGIDISPTMIRRAKELNAAVPNARFHEGNGVDLSTFHDATFDFALSYIVFQHIPDEQAILGYVREALRVLKPGGRFLFQARTDRVHGSTDTYNGASIACADVERIAAEAGFHVERVEGEGTHYTYFHVAG